MPPAFSATDRMSSFAVSLSEDAADTKASSTLPRAFQEYRFRIALERGWPSWNDLANPRSQPARNSRPCSRCDIEGARQPLRAAARGLCRHDWPRQHHGLMVFETGGGRHRRYGRCVPSCASIVRMGCSFGFSDFSMAFESAGNDAAASFQRTGYQGCRISPPDLAIVAVVHAAQPKLCAGRS